MIDKLIEGNITNNPECLEQVEKLLMTLYTAWKDVVENPRPDGVPSKEIQPDEFKAWQEQQEPTVAEGSKVDGDSSKDKNAVGSKLRLKA